MNVVNRFQGVGISREEYLLLKALVLANAEVGSVEDSLPLTRLRENISASLSDCIIALRWALLKYSHERKEPIGFFFYRENVSIWYFFKNLFVGSGG